MTGFGSISGFRPIPYGQIGNNLIAQAGDRKEPFSGEHSVGMRYFFNAASPINVGKSDFILKAEIIRIKDNGNIFLNAYSNEGKIFSCAISKDDNGDGLPNFFTKSIPGNKNEFIGVMDNIISRINNMDKSKQNITNRLEKTIHKNWEFRNATKVPQVIRNVFLPEDKKTDNRMNEYTIIKEDGTREKANLVRNEDNITLKIGSNPIFGVTYVCEGNIKRNNYKISVKPSFISSADPYGNSALEINENDKIYIRTVLKSMCENETNEYYNNIIKSMKDKI